MMCVSLTEPKMNATQEGLPTSARHRIQLYEHTLFIVAERERIRPFILSSITFSYAVHYPQTTS